MGMAYCCCRTFIIRYSVEPTAARPTTAAAMAKIVSKVLTAGAAATTGAGRGAPAAGADGRGAAAAAGAAAVGRAGAGAWGGAAAAGAAVPAIGPVGPPGGRVGNLIVGAAEGLGGKLIRTVSFLGCTLPVSFLGGTAPVGTFGIFSAIA